MLLFLHGFLGQKEDWDPLLSFLPRTLNTHALDLPGHGDAPIVEDIILAIKEQVKQADIIVGYSAGGRIALELKSRFPDAYGQVVVLSSHPGVLTEREHQSRKQWAQMLQELPFDRFLEKWYDQKLFQSLKAHPIFPSLFQRRKRQNSTALAQFFDQMSLLKKTAPEIFPNTIFLYGKQDLKYAELCRKLSLLEHVKIENAGHALHLENPKAAAAAIERILHEHNGKCKSPSYI